MTRQDLTRFATPKGFFFFVDARNRKNVPTYYSKGRQRIMDHYVIISFSVNVTNLSK
jgi:hypothetical protein